MAKLKKILSVVLVIAMVASLTGISVLADGPEEPHVHSALCGYAEAVAGTDCNMDCTDTDGDGIIDHAEGCAYAAAVEGHACVIETVNAQIAALPAVDDITLSDGDAITAARSAYSAMDASLTAYVDTAKLTAAEAKIAELNASAVAYVAQIGDNKYETLDAAVVESKDGDVIELLANAALTVQTVSKTVYIEGNGFNVEVPNLEKYVYESCKLLISGKLTFDNCKVTIPETAKNWNICIGGAGVLEFINGSQCTISGNGIYTDNGAVINVNASKLTLEDMTYTSMMGDSYGTLNVTNSSEFVINKMTPNGITGFNINVDASTLTITNGKNQGIVKGSLTLSNGAAAVVSGNSTGYNLYSASVLTINDGTSLTMTGNTSKAILMQGGKINVLAGGTLTVQENGYNWLNANSTEDYPSKAAIAVGMWNASAKVLPYTAATVNFADGANVNISNNYVRGISNFGTVTLGSGTVIVNNGTGTHTGESVSRAEDGGGIYNAGKLTLNTGAKVYNNHAANSGDDIYNTTYVVDASNSYYPNIASTLKTMTGTMTLNDAGAYNAKLSDCGDTITGWFYDGVKSGEDSLRWNVNGCIGGRDEYYDEYTVTAGDSTANALKAAHPYVAPYVPPVTITYTLTVKFVDENGTEISNTQTGTHSAGAAYSTSAVTVDGYTFDHIDASFDTASGYMNSNKTVVYVYTADTVIDDEDTPLDPAPDDTDIPDDDVPLVPSDDEVDIADDDVALDDSPKTGDNSASLMLLWSIFVISTTSLAVMMLTSKKNRKSGK